jgi:hypothetical protein
MEVISPNPTQIQFEYPGGSYHACNVAVNTYYDMEIIYGSYSGGNGWLYKVLTSSSCNSFIFYTSSGKVSGPSLDMMESTDFTASDFTNVKAAAYFDPTLEYYTSTGWTTTSTAVSYNAGGTPNTVGMQFNCAGFGHVVLDTLMSSTYAPPPTTGGYTIVC